VQEGRVEAEIDGLDLVIEEFPQVGGWEWGGENGNLGVVQAAGLYGDQLNARWKPTEHEWVPA
jgi:hypothetical protein